MPVARLVSKSVIAPSHEHDCDRCKLIGSLDGKDLYYCPVFGGNAEVVVRSSSEPSDVSAWGLDWGMPPAGTHLAAAFAILARGVQPHAYRTIGAVR